MIHKVYFADNEGQGFILEDFNELDSLILLENREFEFFSISPNCLTDLGGFYSRPVTYCGIFKDLENAMVFYIGDNSDLFGNRFYFKIVHYLSPTRFFIKFGEGFGRDFNLIEGHWK